jgi:16S rRNA (guanine1207-N2)-methyltransferase
LTTDSRFCVYGAPDPALAPTPPGAVQVSPLLPGAHALEDFAPESLSGAVICAPPGTVERRYVLALALRALKPGGTLTALAPKDKGGARLGRELQAFGGVVQEQGRRHQRICVVDRGPALEGLEAAITAGRPRRLDGLDLWSQPGLFSWDRIDPGTALLLSVLPPLEGRGADFGCGVGVIARAVLVHAGVARLDLIDLDRRAIDCARRNVNGPRAVLHWADVRAAFELKDLDFVVMNPPFHDSGAEDRSLGQAFVRRAREALRKGGRLWMVANRHLPYEAELDAGFAEVVRRAEAGGFKVYEARA